MTPLLSLIKNKILLYKKRRPFDVPPSKRHWFSWSGTSMPCTGTYFCRKCGKPTRATPTDYSTVNYNERCPAPPGQRLHNKPLR